MSASSPKVLFLFIDGIGLGRPFEDNPFSRLSLPGFRRWSDGQPWTSEIRTVVSPERVFRPIDATLGVEGLPQSGTGQASLFSGVNCARIAERHFGPYPHSQTKPILAEKSLFHQVKNLGGIRETPVAFANAYPEIFFQRRKETGRWTVTTFCCVHADVPLRGYSDWQDGRALTADITAQAWTRDLGYELEPISESEAAHRLVRLGDEHALTVFEYYLTDKAGHSQSHRRARRILESVDRFLEALHTAIDPDRHLAVITSDHGNLEDLSTSSHTRNPVPFAAYGREAGTFGQIESILEVTPGIVRVLDRGNV